MGGGGGPVSYFIKRDPKLKKINTPAITVILGGSAPSARMS